MRIIAKRTLMEMAAKHADSVGWIEEWYRTVNKSDWGNVVDVKADYPSADLVGDKIVFNVKGNRYRLIVGVNYETGIVYIKHLLTHAEYDKGKWKE